MKRRQKRRYEKEREKRGYIFPLRTTSGHGVDTMSKMAKREQGKKEREEIYRMYSDVEDDNDYDDDRNWESSAFLREGAAQSLFSILDAYFFILF